MSRLLVVAFQASEIEQMDGFSRSLALPFDIVLVSEHLAIKSEAEKLYFVPGGGQLTADVVSKTLVHLAPSYDYIAAASSMASKDLLPRVAAICDGSMITDVISMINPKTFKRAMQAGAIIATVEATSFPIVLTVRSSGFPGLRSSHDPEVRELSIENSSRAKVTGLKDSSGSRPDLNQAKLIISGGRPLKDSETFEKVIGGFADAFGGSVGATRAAVDAGISPNETQVGQTGKIVAPDIYIAAGISGSTQHVAGIKDSKLIVAINKDPDAPIFAVADMGIVGDLFDVLPQLQTALKSSQ